MVRLRIAVPAMAQALDVKFKIPFRERDEVAVAGPRPIKGKNTMPRSLWPYLRLSRGATFKLVRAPSSPLSHVPTMETDLYVDEIRSPTTRAPFSCLASCTESPELSKTRNSLASAAPPLSVVFTLWLSMTPAEGVRLRPAARRTRSTRTRLMRPQTLRPA